LPSARTMVAYDCNVTVSEKIWTGSYNCSFVPGLSFENVVILQCEKIAKAYMIEFIHLFKNSEAQSAVREAALSSLREDSAARRIRLDQ
jgi:hypothetical protein